MTGAGVEMLLRDRESWRPLPSWPTTLAPRRRVRRSCTARLCRHARGNRRDAAVHADDRDGREASRRRAVAELASTVRAPGVQGAVLHGQAVTKTS